MLLHQHHLHGTAYVEEQVGAEKTWNVVLFLIYLIISIFLGLSRLEEEEIHILPKIVPCVAID